MKSELKVPMLKEEFLEEIERCVHVALLCLQENTIERPNMGTIKKNAWMLLYDYSLFALQPVLY
jgi:hypothetical protein